MDDEKLIENVRNWPCLYDKSNMDFKDREKKRHAWLEIANNLQMDETTAIKRWGNLRERFTKEIRSTKNSSGSGATLRRQWALLDSLQFLKGHIIPRPMRQSAPSLQNDLNSNISLDIEIIGELPLTTELSQLLTVPTAPTKPIVPIQENESTKRLRSPKSSTFRTKKRKAAELDVLDNTILETVKTFQEVCARKARREEVSAEISGFSTMICALISKMKKATQAEVIRRCTEIVLQAQIDENL